MKRIITELEKRKVINLAKNGFSRPNIAKMSGVSQASVDRILRKTGVSSNGRAKAVRPNHDEKVRELHSKGIPDKEAYSQSGLSYAQYLFVRKKLGLKYIAVKQVCNLSQRQKEILIGTMMGDGNISKCGKGTRIETYKINIGHSHKQYKYFEWKLEQLNIKGSIFCRMSSKNHWGLWASSLPYENLKYYYRMFYINGVKTITKNYL
jgi:predicted transcriptional regulator